MAEERGRYIKDEYRTHVTEGTHYLLVIGIDNYVHFKKLNKAVRDAIAVKDLLTKRYQFEENNTFTLFDEEATRENIMQKFRLLVGKLEPNDSLLIYYAGHGNYDEMLDMGYWIPVESEPNKTGAYLSNNDLILFINKMKGRHIFLVSDSCFSGTLLAETRDAYTDKVKDLPSRWALSSGRKELVLDDSPFVKSFLTYLEANKEQELLVQDLISYVERNTANNAAQTPFGNRLKSVGDQGGAFVFRLSAEAMLSHDQIAFAALQTRYEQFANAKHIDHEKYAALYQDLQTFALATQDSSLAAAANELKSTFPQLIEDKEWAETQRINTKKAYNDFIENHQHSHYAGEAEQKIEEIEDENAWKQAKQQDKINAYRQYINKFRQGKHIEEAKKRQNELINDEVKDSIPDPPPPFTKVVNIEVPLNKEKAKIAYATLFKAFYEDGNISPNEKNLLKDKQTELGLTEIEIKEIEAELSEKTQTTATKEFQTFEKFETKPFSAGEGLGWGKNKKAIFSSIAILFLLVVFFIFKDKIWGVPSPSGEAIVADTTESVSHKAETTVPSPSGENTAADTTKSVSAEAKITEEIAYKALKNTKAAYTAFLQKYPNSTYKEDIQKRLDLLNKPIDLPPFEEPEMVKVVGGTFDMGYKEGRDGKDEYVNASKPLRKDLQVGNFYMGKYEVTIREYMIFVNETQSNYPEWQEKGNAYNLKTGKEKKYYVPFVANDKQPIVGVSWNNAVAYCKWLTKKTGKKYRLPTEEEWEYAARGGKESGGYMYAGSNTLSSVAWNTDNSGSKTHPVGSKTANELGIYDMSGNVWECTSSGWSSNYESSRTSQSYVLRGGSWSYYDGNCRVANRGSNDPTDRDGDVGFRLAQDF